MPFHPYPAFSGLLSGQKRQGGIFSVALSVLPVAADSPLERLQGYPALWSSDFPP